MKWIRSSIFISPCRSRRHRMLIISFPVTRWPACTAADYTCGINAAKRCVWNRATARSSDGTVMRICTQSRSRASLAGACFSLSRESSCANSTRHCLLQTVNRPQRNFRHCICWNRPLKREAFSNRGFRTYKAIGISPIKC